MRGDPLFTSPCHVVLQLNMILMHFEEHALESHRCTVQGILDSSLFERPVIRDHNRLLPKTCTGGISSPSISYLLRDLGIPNISRR